METELYTAEALASKSVQVILANQSISGAYVACPNFEQYRYCWFRDGSFTAHGMSVVGQTESATRFHDWAAAAVLRNSDAARACIERAQGGLPLDQKRVLNTRYTLAGQDTSDDWPNFQLDGFGTWLWAATDHLKRTGDADAAHRWRPALSVAADYLAALWRLPNFDCWEEYGDRVHVSTLLALCGGLRAYAHWAGSERHAGVARDIRSFILDNGMCDSRLRKFADSGCEVDAALLGMAAPYAVFDAHDPVVDRTIAAIETDLRARDAGRGLHRYAADTYYGGGEWVLLTAWLGWHYATAGNMPAARGCLNWVVAQADQTSYLAEQVSAHLIAPEKKPEWERRWGAIATPLLWSHGQMLILSHAVSPSRSDQPVRGL